MTEGPVLKLCISENKNFLLIVHLLLQKSALLFLHSLVQLRHVDVFISEIGKKKKYCKVNW